LFKAFIEKKYLFLIMNKLVFATAFAFMFSSCDPKKNTSNSCIQNENTETLVLDGSVREYVLYVPNSYDDSMNVPVLFNFHGFGDTSENYMNYSDMRALSESETFILVYPQGSCLDGSSHWNPCPTSVDNKSTADDLGFFQAMINELSSQYNVDMERIYAAGYSNGGMMAYGLANHKSEVIAAVASVSGAMLDCIGPTSHSMPVVHLHGTSDSVLPYNGSSDWSSVQTTLNHWINFNNIITTPTLSSDTSGAMTIEHYVYNQLDSSVSVEHYKYIGGDHVWFSETYEGQSTSEIVWNFVSRYDINGLR